MVFSGRDQVGTALNTRPSIPQILLKVDRRVNTESQVVGTFRAKPSL